ncbi:MAG: pyruvate kinase [Planctomycetaceae bacterium]|nr:pyruvate kinase [Planctomycetaceae bacterium]
MQSSKTKIVATVGPASGDREKLSALIAAGVNLFRLNFAHGDHDWLAEVAATVRQLSEELKQPIGLLGDLSGPKIRLGSLPDDQIHCHEGEEYDFVRNGEAVADRQLTCTYDRLIDDLQVDNHVLLADGTVSMKVISKADDGSSVKCRVEDGGVLRSRQGVNLPGVAISTPSMTEKDHADLEWGIQHGLDYVGLSFVRSADDIRRLRETIASFGAENQPRIVAKIEKLEAIEDIEAILDETDAIMVARGDLGVETDIARLPILQKQIIAGCKKHRIPVITATQMLDSMQWNERPTRAEASDVANAVLDGTDAIMLSGETAVGEYPVEAVQMMNCIAIEAETLIEPHGESVDTEALDHTRALAVTEAIARGAGHVADELSADLIAVATHSGRSAMALSKQRRTIPILALSDRIDVAQRMALFWGVLPIRTDKVSEGPEELLSAVVQIAMDRGIVRSGSRIVLIASSNWSEGHDMTLVHEVRS